jgi:signal transduction histidine kinase
VIASLVAAILLDFVFFPPVASTILYAVPIVIAARFCSARLVLATGLVVIVVDALDLYVDRAPLELWPFSIIAIAVIVALATQVATLRKSEQRRIREAEAAREQLREFISLVVHDLRAPLTVALGYLQLVEREFTPSDERLRPHVEKVDQALHRATRLVGDLLDAIRIGRGRFVLHHAPSDLTALARGVVDEQRLSDVNHTYLVEAPPRVTGFWDATRLQQVLANLVSNAGKYSSPGTDVRVSLREQDDEAILSVSDQGSGIAPSDLDRIFQPFARLNPGGQTAGTGLGLYITRGIVEAHGGRIWVESVVGRGTTFFVTLPRGSVDGRGDPPS